MKTALHVPYEAEPTSLRAVECVVDVALVIKDFGGFPMFARFVYWARERLMWRAGFEVAHPTADEEFIAMLQAGDLSEGELIDGELLAVIEKYETCSPAHK